MRKATSRASEWPDASGPPGSKSRACRQGSPRNLGDLPVSTVSRRPGRRGRSGPGPGAAPRLRGANGATGGTAERRQRSEAGRAGRGRSPLIVPGKSGNPPQGTRRREAADRAVGLCEGQMARTSSREVISTRQAKLANLAFLGQRVRDGVNSPPRSDSIARGAGCSNWASPDLWEPRAGNCPWPPGQS